MAQFKGFYEYADKKKGEKHISALLALSFAFALPPNSYYKRPLDYLRISNSYFFVLKHYPDHLLIMLMQSANAANSLFVYEICVNGLHCSASNTIHSADPCHLVFNFELFGDAFRSNHLF